MKGHYEAGGWMLDHVRLDAIMYLAGWRGGGVATQRPAKPCTPVRFRSAPPAPPPKLLPVPACAPTAQPPNLQAPPPSPHQGQIIGQHQQAQGKHPESNDREKAKDAAKQQQHADAKTQPARIAAHGMPNSLIIVLRHGFALPNTARTGFSAGHQGKNAGNLSVCHESSRAPTAPRQR